MIRRFLADFAAELDVFRAGLAIGLLAAVFVFTAGNTVAEAITYARDHLQVVVQDGRPVVIEQGDHP